jgi:hypothetical protein
VAGRIVGFVIVGIYLVYRVGMHVKNLLKYSGNCNL